MSRDLNELEPETRAKVDTWVAACAAKGVTILVYCTYRTPAEQAELFKIGRELPGKKVTNAPAWQSWHNYRRAVDAVPLLFGKPLWNYDASHRNWIVTVSEAETAGLEWAGRWKTFREYVHFQNVPQGLTLAMAYKAATETT